MKHRRVLLVVILASVGLDLAWPDMPGALVFEPSGRSNAAISA